MIKKKPSINLFGNDYNTEDGTCIRDYIDVNDLSDLHLKILKKIKKAKSIEMNCGYGKPNSVLDVINLFSKISKSKIKIFYKKRRFGDIEKIYCDISRQKKIFKGWKPKIKISQSVKNQIIWEKKLFIKNVRY